MSFKLLGYTAAGIGLITLAIYIIVKFIIHIVVTVVFVCTSLLVRVLMLQGKKEMGVQANFDKKECEFSEDEFTSKVTHLPETNNCQTSADTGIESTSMSRGIPDGSDNEPDDIDRSSVISLDEYNTTEEGNNDNMSDEESGFLADIVTQQENANQDLAISKCKVNLKKDTDDNPMHPEDTEQENASQNIQNSMDVVFGETNVEHADWDNHALASTTTTPDKMSKIHPPLSSMTSTQATDNKLLSMESENDNSFGFGAKADTDQEEVSHLDSGYLSSFESPSMKLSLPETLDSTNEFNITESEQEGILEGKNDKILQDSEAPGIHQQIIIKAKCSEVTDGKEPEPMRQLRDEMSTNELSNSNSRGKSGTYSTENKYGRQMKISQPGEKQNTNNQSGSIDFDENSPTTATGGQNSKDGNSEGAKGQDTSFGRESPKQPMSVDQLENSSSFTIEAIFTTVKIKSKQQPDSTRMYAYEIPTDTNKLYPSDKLPSKEELKPTIDGILHQASPSIQATFPESITVDNICHQNSASQNKCLFRPASPSQEISASDELYLPLSSCISPDSATNIKMKANTGPTEQQTHKGNINNPKPQQTRDTFSASDYVQASSCTPADLQQTYNPQEEDKNISPNEQSHQSERSEGDDAKQARGAKGMAMTLNPGEPQQPRDTFSTSEDVEVSSCTVADLQQTFNPQEEDQNISPNEQSHQSKRSEGDNANQAGSAKGMAMTHNPGEPQQPRDTFFASDYVQASSRTPADLQQAYNPQEEDQNISPNEQSHQSKRSERADTKQAGGAKRMAKTPNHGELQQPRDTDHAQASSSRLLQDKNVNAKGKGNTRSKQGPDSKPYGGAGRKVRTFNKGKPVLKPNPKESLSRLPILQQRWTQHPEWNSQNHANPQRKQQQRGSCQYLKTDDNTNNLGANGSNVEGHTTTGQHKPTGSDNRDKHIGLYLQDDASACVPREARVRNRIVESRSTIRQAILQARGPPRPGFLDPANLQHRANIQRQVYRPSARLPDVVEESLLSMQTITTDDGHSEPDVTNHNH